jgi:hypothetical protein
MPNSRGTSGCDQPLAIRITREVLLHSRAAAYQVLKLDPLLPEAHANFAAVAVFLDYNWTAAGHQLQLATAREPIPPNVSHLYGFFYLLPRDRIKRGSRNWSVPSSKIRSIWNAGRSLEHCFG